MEIIKRACLDHVEPVLALPHISLGPGDFLALCLSFPTYKILFSEKKQMVRASIK